ncbi:hypothetical protein COT72_01865 [archaeon CG10_big_fil_rev_8_21_14_0_10_43_11]|nr:MAG: hypothetical protein COT72_01865 [archaeon CG10_big_fil_rev_8_21_14_0_10_43_11]
MAVEAYLPTLGTVLITAVIDSVNPCAIGVLILMISVIMSAKQSVSRMLLLGLLYITSIFTVYLLAGLGLTYAFTVFPLVLTEYISIVVGMLIIGAGLIEIKDFFWYGKGFSLTIPHRFSKKLRERAMRISIPGVMILGAFVAAVELPCTGAPYLAIITLLSQYFDVTAGLLLVLYNLIFVSPLVVILVLVAFGKELYEVKKWHELNKPFMRLLAGLLLIFMGWLLILISNGTINFG